MENNREYVFLYCMGTGMALGTALGAAMQDIIAGMCFGLAAGSLLGLTFSCFQYRDQGKESRIVILAGILPVLAALLFLFLGRGYV